MVTSSSSSEALSTCHLSVDVPCEADGRKLRVTVPRKPFRRRQGFLHQGIDCVPIGLGPHALFDQGTQIEVHGETAAAPCKG